MSILWIPLYMLFGLFIMIQILKWDEEKELEDFNTEEWKFSFGGMFLWPLFVCIFIGVFIHKSMENEGSWFKMLIKKRTFGKKDRRVSNYQANDI